ncbi:MAG TPA: mandelate racemase/muconate lactonizing enzyme family protein [Verrucomicrobiales bacterium]|nr:mandelate racemase/muconate lactonizing enzyme family protein [Verrucomicrobiales bacterium]
MKIDSVDLFYLKIPRVKNIGDGSQDALLVRVRAGNFEGWGECEASPLVTIAAWNCPTSHSACQPVSASVLGQSIDTPADIKRIHTNVKANSLDLLQTDHLLSGIDIALWDLLGRKLEEPVYQLLGYPTAHPKTAYASVLFGDSPAETFQKAENAQQQGYRAVKFGWGCYGRQSPAADADQVAAAREGLGKDRCLLIDAGTLWVDDPTEAEKRLSSLETQRVLWLEEPFVSGALNAYRKLSSMTTVKLAGGEGCHDFHQARHMIDHGGIGFIQIDAGRIGGLSIAKQVADYAATRKVKYVNHTFTTQLALSASLQPYAGLSEHDLCEYPVEASALAQSLTPLLIKLDAEGHVHLPETPGLGITPISETIRKYLTETEIVVNGKVIYQTPTI